MRVSVKSVMKKRLYNDFQNFFCVKEYSQPLRNNTKMTEIHIKWSLSTVCYSIEITAVVQNDMLEREFKTDATGE